MNSCGCGSPGFPAIKVAGASISPVSVDPCPGSTEASETLPPMNQVTLVELENPVVSISGGTVKWNPIFTL
jgi:hypothetical protein